MTWKRGRAYRILASYEAVRGLGIIRPDSGGTDLVIPINDSDFDGSDVDGGMQFEFDIELQ